MQRHRTDSLSDKLREIVGHDGVLAEPDELLVYECDGLPQHKFAPRAVVFPRSTEEVAELLRLLAREGVPFSPRGAGTGLSGGALALNRGVIIELARMRRLLKLDVEQRLAVVQTGMVNAQLSRAAAPFGLHYAPDPSSQAACTIGGNIAENAGGIHCLKYGTTVDHVLAARVVLAGGELLDLDQKTPGYDLLGVFVGSEGTFGIATEATLRLLPIAPAVRTLLADFKNVDDASRAVSAIIAAGLVPAALEMMDGAIIRAVEESVFRAGLPLDAEAALLVELDGLESGLDDDTARAESICREHGARNVWRAADEAERRKLWAARKGAFGAMGRISPDTMLQDAVVPRSRLPEVLAATYSIGAKYGLRVANVFHAGDGNLHPFICFDARIEDEVRRVKEASREVMETCVRAGGSITGEHGVGLDKSAYLPLIFSDADMQAMLSVRAAFDPSGLCNPGKIIPTSRSCGEARGAGIARLKRRDGPPAPRASEDEANRKRAVDNGAKRIEEAAGPALNRVPAASPSTPAGAARSARARAFDAVEARRALSLIVGSENVVEAKLDQLRIDGDGVLSMARDSIEVAPGSIEEACEVLRAAARESWAVVPAGGGTWLDVGNPLRRADLIISTRRMSRLVEHEPADLTATAEAGLTLAALNAELTKAGQWLPLDPPDDGRVSLGGMAATGLKGTLGPGYGAPRGYVIGMRLALADGRLIRVGGRVVKNVAGYDLCKLFTGSYGTLGLILELTFKLRPVPPDTATLFVTGPVMKLLRSANALLAAKLFPVAAELLSPGMAAYINLHTKADECALLIRFAGSERAVAYQLEQARRLLLRDEERAGADAERLSDEGCWNALAAVPLKARGGLSCRAQMRPGQLGQFLSILEAEGGARSSSLWQAGACDGSVRFIGSDESASAASPEACLSSLSRLRAWAHESGAALVIEGAPTEVRLGLDAWGEPGPAGALMRRVKRELDPQEIFSPGRFVAGI